MSSPLVSICIPTYNRPNLLQRAVCSCLAQTYPNFEIVVTDNSTDFASREVLAKLSDPRIRYYSNSGNIGATASVNRGLSLATGKYISTLMDDDLLKPQCLELMVEAFENHPTVGVVMAPMHLIGADDERIFPKFYIFRTMRYRYRYQVGDGFVDRRRVLKDFLTRDYPCCVPSGIMYRAEGLRRIGPADPSADFAGDLDFAMRLAVYYDFYYIDQVLTSWRYVPSSHTATLHQNGLNIGAFYYVTRKCLAQDETKKLFADEWETLVRDSIFFCSCRALLNGLAGLRAKSPRLILKTIKTILKEDPASEVTQVRHENRSFDDVRKIKALVLQDQLDVLKRALGLRTNVADNKHPSLRHDWYLTGTEKESAQANCLAVRADRDSGARGVNHSFAFSH